MFRLLLQICIIISSGTKSHTAGDGATGLPKFPAILIFGDSLVDTGNNNYIETKAKANHYPYGMSLPIGVATGRFSDGRLMGDLIAEQLGIKKYVPPFLSPILSADDLQTGVCFASAGSGYDDYTTQFTGVIPVSYQVGVQLREYRERLRSVVGADEAQNIISNALVFVVAGSNDYLLNYNALVPVNKRRLDYPIPCLFRDFLHYRIKGVIKLLYDAGCRKMLIAGIPPYIDVTGDYNYRLQSMLPQVQASLPGSKIVFGDIATPMSDVSYHPIKYGLLVASPIIPCCVDLCPPLAIPCPIPAQFYSFDGVHPTETVYKAMSNYLLANAIPQFLN